jgi:DNA-binding NarL/FixJ family response regulator
MRLTLEPDIIVVGEARNADLALKLAEKTQPDLILLDIRMPGTAGLAIIRQLYQVAPACKVIIVTLYDSPDYRLRAEEAGAVAFVAKQEQPESLLTAIRQAIRPTIHPL